MPKLKDLLPNIFGKKESEGRLETDALPVDDSSSSNNNNNNNNSNTNGIPQSPNQTPTASAELTESVLRELNDPNYNSGNFRELPSPSNPTTSNGNNVGAGAGAVALYPPPMGGGMQLDNTVATMPPNGELTPAGPTTMNTMNVHNAQQQLVMQFSNINKLHFGSVYNFNSNITATTGGSANHSRKSSASCMDDIEATGVDGKRSATRKTTSIVAMMQSQQEPNHRILDTVATHLGEGWKQVMRDLGHSEGQIEQALIDHQMHGGIKEVIYQLLLQWLRNADDGVATMGHLTTLLWESQHRDCVQRMKLVWKTDAKRKTSR